MAAFLPGLVLGALLVLVAFAIQGRRKPGPPRRPSGSADTPDTETYRDPFVDLLYSLQASVLSVPTPSTPDELLLRWPFIDLVETFSASAVETETLMRYFMGEDPVLTWAALSALAQRPHDPAVEERLLLRMNDGHPWTRHFILRVLEAWHSDDPKLTRRVLLGLDESWDHPDLGPILEDFLRRRPMIGPQSVEELEPPAEFGAGSLRTTINRWVDPAIAEPLLAELDRASAPPGAAVSSSPRAPARKGDPKTVKSRSGVGWVTPPGGVHADGLLAYPSADVQLERVLAALSGSPRRSVLIVGESGVGKTSLMRRAAARLSHGGWTTFEASASEINAGTMYVGALEERLGAVIQQLRSVHKMLWVLRDFHQLLWIGRHSQSPTGVLEMLIPVLDSGEVLMLGETRPAALEGVLIKFPEVERLFEIVRLEPPSESELAGMLDAWATTTSERSGVGIPSEIRTEAAALARQYLLSQPPPGGVLRLLSGAIARATRHSPDGPDGATKLTMDHLVESLAQLTGLPLDILDERCALDLEAVRRRFESRVIGQSEAVQCLMDRLALLKAGVTDPNRPTGVFLFAGGSGTGKTELARTLADYLFGSADRMLRIDMSELQDASALERLVGDTSDFVSKGSSLVELVRRQPFSVVLLDEFDRANPSVWDVFLQVFDAGRLTDRGGETADFRHTIIILTSNLGTASAGEARLGLVGGDDGVGPTTVRRAVERTFRPEFLNRLDRVIVFQPLTRNVMRQILRKELADAFARRGLRRRDWAVELEESAIDLLVERGFSPALGARPLRRALERLLLTPLAGAIVNRSAPEGDQFLFVRADGDALAVEFVDPDAPAPAMTTAAVTGASLAAGDGVASILFEAHGSSVELEVLRAKLQEIQEHVSTATWSATKEALLLESAAPGFWERPDRFERLGRAEYMDRIERSVRSAGSLLHRLEGNPGTHRSAYPREMVRRLAQQLYLVEAACGEAIETGPRDAFVSLEPVQEDVAPVGVTRDFARRLAGMHEAWARSRGMRFTALGPQDVATGSQVLAIAGFAAYRLLVPEVGLPVLEWDKPGARAPQRSTVRVRVEPQPITPARGGIPGLRRQAEQVLAEPSTLSTAIVRRYREKPSPLVKDLVRGWRTGRIERVLGGDFDIMPARD